MLEYTYCSKGNLVKVISSVLFPSQKSITTKFYLDPLKFDVSLLDFFI